jgi:hypothetical protein
VQVSDRGLQPSAVGSDGGDVIAGRLGRVLRQVAGHLRSSERLVVVWSVRADDPDVELAAEHQPPGQIRPIDGGHLQLHGPSSDGH